MTEKSCRYLRILILFNLLSIFCIVPTIAEKSNDYCAPWVTKTTTNSATINWRGESDGTGLIDYATSSYFNKHHGFEKKIASSIAAQYQHVPLNRPYFRFWQSFYSKDYGINCRQLPAIEKAFFDIH